MKKLAMFFVVLMASPLANACDSYVEVLKGGNLVVTQSDESENCQILTQDDRDDMKEDFCEKNQDIPACKDMVDSDDKYDSEYDLDDRDAEEPGSDALDEDDDQEDEDND
jgi:hypothetical protein